MCYNGTEELNKTQAINVCEKMDLKSEFKQIRKK